MCICSIEVWLLGLLTATKLTGAVGLSIGLGIAVM